VTFCALVYHLAADQNLEETRNKKVFFQRRQNEHPGVKETSLVQFVTPILNTSIWKKSNIFIKLHRTCFSTAILSCSCILYITACFVRNDRNCTTLP